MILLISIDSLNLTFHFFMEQAIKGNFVSVTQTEGKLFFFSNSLFPLLYFPFYHKDSKKSLYYSKATMAESILDFSKELDVGLLDQVVLNFYTGSGTDVKYNKTIKVSNCRAYISVIQLATNGTTIT